jgi:hypothetical protein
LPKAGVEADLQASVRAGILALYSNMIYIIITFIIKVILTRHYTAQAIASSPDRAIFLKETADELFFN